MNNNATNKKKLELKKTAIANLTLSEAQMRMVVGGGNNVDTDDCDSKANIGDTACTSVIVISGKPGGGKTI